MKIAKPFVICGLAIAILCIGEMAVIKRQVARDAAVRAEHAEREAKSRLAVLEANPSTLLSPVTAEGPFEALDSTNLAQSARTEIPSDTKRQTIARPTQPARSAKQPPTDPMARAALYFVGADPEAELYWAQTINNPNVPAHERKDLIEDLNEDGLSDPKNPTVYDLPLILSRIELIEQLADAALDKVNADAFEEAYKDLVNMAGKLIAVAGQ